MIKNITLREAIRTVLKDEGNSDTPSFEKFNEEMGFQYSDYDYDKFVAQLKGYWLTRHLCTDTWVGCMVWFLDNEPVCVTNQSGRKSDMTFKFLSMEAHAKVRQYVMDCSVEHNNCHSEAFTEEELDADVVEPHNRVGFSGQVLDYVGYFADRRCVLVSKDPHQRKSYTESDIGVKFDDDGSEATISVREFYIPLRVEANREDCIAPKKGA